MSESSCSLRMLADMLAFARCLGRSRTGKGEIAWRRTSRQSPRPFCGSAKRFDGPCSLNIVTTIALYVVGGPAVEQAGTADERRPCATT